MGIIEKLRITPEPWEWEDPTECGAQCLRGKERALVLEGEDYYPGYPECGEDIRINVTIEDSNLIRVAPEMLKALIDHCLEMEKIADKYLEHKYEKISGFISIIEKATGKKWTDIKEIIKNE